MTYAKSVFAVLATLVSAALAAFTGDQHIDAQEWVNVVILGVGAINVLYVPNAVSGPVAKTVVAVVSAVLTLLFNFIVGGISTEEVLQMVLAGLAAAGVYAIPNAPRPAHAA